MSHLNPGLLSAYNSLTDKHLAGYFSNTRIRRHLVKVGLITRSGSIVPDKEYKYNVMRKYHERHMRECLAQAIFNKVLDIERHHHIQIKKKLEDFAQRERVNKIKVERSRRYNGDIIPLRSPRPPSGPRNGHTWHSGPEVEPSESSESPGSSRPNTAPEKIQRPIRLQPINSGSTHRPSQSSSPRTSSGDKERLGSTVLERDPVRHVATGKYSSGISPYCLPVINNFVTPVPPSSKRKARSFKSTPNGTMRGRKLRPTTAPSIPAVTKESKFHKMSTHSSASVTMVLHCKSLRISHNDIDLRHEVKVFQQHCGGENICVYKGKLREGEPFRFISRRHRGFPFSLTFYLNGLQVERLSSCCEFRHRRGFRLGGKRGHFSFVSVDGASPCYKCIIAMGLDKKPTPPPIGRQQDTEGEGFLGNSLEMTEDSRDKEKENVKEDSQCNMQAESSQGHDSNHRDSEEKDSIQDKEEDKAKDGYDEDFEADDERVDDERDESEPHAMNKETSSPSNEGRDFQSESKEDRQIDNQESEDNEKDIYTDSEAEEDDKIRKKTTPSLSSRTSSFSSDNSNEDSESEAEEMKEAMPDRASSSISKVEWTEDDKTGQDVEEHIQLEHSEDDPRQGRLKELKASEEPMKAASTDNDEATSDANVKTTPTVEAVGLEPLDSALDRASLEGSLSNMQTGMTGGVARDDTEASTRETVEDVEPERAKSVQEKLAEAIMKEAQCDSEPEFSDTSTEEEEEQNCPGVQVQENFTAALPQLPCTKIKVTDEQPVGAEGEAPVKDIEDEMNANFVENQKVEDTTELPQEAQEPGFETKDEKMEETSTKTELQEQKTLRMVLENSEEVLQESENNVKENKMEIAATETGENQTDESGEAHAEGTDYNFMAMCEGKAEENENNDNAEDNETRGEGTEDGGDLSAAEVAVSNMYDDEAKAEDEWTAVEANKTEEGDTDASEHNESNGHEKGEILEHTTEGDTEETNEKNDIIGQSDELTEAELEAPTEEERNLDKLSTLEDGSGHTEQEENHDTIQQDKAQTGEEDDDFNIKKTSAQENQVNDEDNTDMVAIGENNNEVQEEPTEEADSVAEQDSSSTMVLPATDEEATTDQPAIVKEEQKPPDYEDKSENLLKMTVETETKNEELDEKEGDIDLKENDSEPKEMGSKDELHVEEQIELENNTEMVNGNMDTELECETETVVETEVEQTVVENENDRSNLTETVVKSHTVEEDRVQAEECEGDNGSVFLDADQSHSRTKDLQGQDTESNESEKEQEAETVMPRSMEAENGEMRVLEIEEQEETKAELVMTEEGVKAELVKSEGNTEQPQNDASETDEKQKLESEEKGIPGANIENENEETKTSPEEHEETQDLLEGSTDGINKQGPTDVADTNITEAESELKAQDEQHDQVQPLMESDPNNVLDTENDGRDPTIAKKKDYENEANVEEYCMVDGGNRDEQVIAEGQSDIMENRLEITEPTVIEELDVLNETESRKAEREEKVNKSELNDFNDISEEEVKTEQNEETIDTHGTPNLLTQSVGQFMNTECEPEAVIDDDVFNTTSDVKNAEATAKEDDKDHVTNLEDKEAEVPSYEEESLHEDKADSQPLVTEPRDGEDTSELRSNHSKDEEAGGLRATQGMSDDDTEKYSTEAVPKTEDQSKDKVESSVSHSELEYRGETQ